MLKEVNEKQWALVITVCLGLVGRCQSVNMKVYTDPMISASTESFHLGGLFPVSRQGSNGLCEELRLTNIERLEGMVFAIRTINANSSILPQVNLTFDIRDTCALENVALENSLEYVQNSEIFCSNVTSGITAVSGVVGAARSSVSASTASLFRLFQIPQISYASTAALLSNADMFDYFFRTVSSDIFQARALADLIVNFGWRYIFILNSDDTYGTEGVNSLISKLQERNDSGICIAYREALPMDSTKTEFYDRVVQDMSQEWVRNASVAVLFGHVEGAIGIMDAILRGGDNSFLQEITWIASDSWADALPQTYHTLARGMMGILPQPGNLANFRNSHFNQLNPNTSSNPWFAGYWESVFNCSLMDPTCNDGSEARNLSRITPSAATSNVIDAVFAFAHALDQMVKDHCSNGMLCDAITITRPVGRAINGILLRDYLYNVSFPTTFSSGSELLFDSNGDIQGSYLIINLQTNMNSTSFETIGTWDHINLLQLAGNVEWNDGGSEAPESVCSYPCEPGYEQRQVPNRALCCWTCERCLGESSASSGERCFRCDDFMMPDVNQSSCVEIPVTFFSWSSPFAIVILLLTSIGIVMASLVGIMFIVFHNKKVIKASSRELSALVLVGISLCYIIPFFFVVKPTPAICGVRRFAIGFCFAISYSALLVRSNRIHRIFNQRRDRISSPPRFIGTLSQVVFTFLLISVQVLIAVIWLSVEHPSVKIQQLDATTVELRCGESPYFGLSVSLVYNLVLLLLSTYFAFLTRKVPDNFNEAKIINITLYSLCIIWVGFVPAYFISVQFGTVYENFFLLLAVFMSASVTLLCLLAPKVFLAFKKDGNQADSTHPHMTTIGTSS